MNREVSPLEGRRRPPLRLADARVCASPRSRARARRSRRGRARLPIVPLAAATVTAARTTLGPLGGGAVDDKRLARWASAVLVLVSLGAHGGFGLAIWRARVAPEKTRTPTHIIAHVRDVAAPPPKAPEVAKKPPAPPLPPKMARLVPRARSLAHAPEPAPPPAAPAPVKVVGLSLEATSESGSGPAFATGDTLAGATSETAAVPHAPIADTAVAAPPGPNRVARGVPRAGSVFTPPRRLEEVKPHYPDAERAAGREADVLLVVSLDEKGRVVKVTLGTSSGVPSFDEAARQAALKERFSPALRDGTPVPTTISFTTHFRLDTP